MIKIGICDDEEMLLKKNKEIVEGFIADYKIIAEISEYTNGDFMLADIEDGMHFDLLLLDIEMPHKDGMEIANQIKTILPECLIIFVTSHLKYAIDSFALSIFRYIPKQELQPRLIQALKDAVSTISLESDDVYIIQNQKRLEKIPMRDILYIRKNEKNSIIITRDKETKVRKSLAQVYSELNSEDFIYIDRGCIVNIIHIMQVKNGEVLLKGNISLPISRSHIRKTKELINSYWGKVI